MGPRTVGLANQFEAAVAEFTEAIKQLSDEKWNAICGDEGWTVGVTAEHVAGQFYPIEHEYISAAAEGQPFPTYTWDDINGMNDRRAAKNSGATKADVLKTLAEDGGAMAAYLRGLTDEQLDRGGLLPLANAEVTAEQLILGGVLIDHVKGHLASIRAVI